MTPAEANALFQQTHAALEVAQLAHRESIRAQWRAYSDVWLADVRRRFPVPDGSIEVVETFAAEGIQVPYRRWIETIKGWEGKTWHSKPAIERIGREVRRRDNPLDAYTTDRRCWSSEPQISPTAMYRGAAEDWRAFLARWGRS